LVAHALIGLIAIYLQKWLIDDVFVGRQHDQFLPLLLWYAVCVGASFILGLAGPYVLVKGQTILRTWLFDQMLRSLYAMRVQNLREHETGRLISYFNNDVQAVVFMFVYLIPEWFLQVVRLFAVLVVLGITSIPVLIAFASLVIGYVLMERYFGPRLKAATKASAEQQAKIVAKLEEGIGGTREILALNRMDWESGRLRNLYNRYMAKIRRETTLLNQSVTYRLPVKWLPRLIILMYGGYLVLTDRMSIGTLTVGYQFSTQLLEATDGLFAVTMGIHSRQGYLERIHSLLSTERIQDGSVRLTGGIQSIEFQNVSFRYPGEEKDVISNVSFTLPVGQKIAVVGASGAGKSTVARLLSLLYPPSSGEVLINGVPLTELVRGDWLRRMAVVSQDGFVFPDSIQNNLLLGRTYLSQPELIAACKAAQIHDFILSLPQGYDTAVGERGVTVSGGQKQRLTLARALVGSPELLILDEATSALDLRTEKEIFSQLDQTRQGKTTLIIAHRLSTVQNADLVLVFEDGRLTESGRPEELLRDDSLFRRLVEAEKLTSDQALAV
jgi:ABC-type multidrug transport system fused ATPase/permease subunit